MGTCTSAPPNRLQTANAAPSTLYERFGSLAILRYEVPGFEQLTLKQKELLYYLSQAALAGRDITWDQNFKFNLKIRRTLEEIYRSYMGDRTTKEFEQFTTYLKQVWFHNGIHDSNSMDKLAPQFSKEYFANELLAKTPSLEPHRKKLTKKLSPVLFDPTQYSKKVSLDCEAGDIVLNSAVNFYDGQVTEQEVSAYFAAKRDPADLEPVSFGLNTRRIKENGSVVEQVYKIGGMYSTALVECCKWLHKATGVAESPLQKECFELLIKFYETGDLKYFDEYNAKWVKDVDPAVDAIHGFIETYDDCLGLTGTYESVVSFKDPELTSKFNVLSQEASFFEAQSPIHEEYKKPHVVGISYKIINVIMESGAASPTTPIGINLPNADWIRTTHGSKSVSLRNIENAYAKITKQSGALQEFYLPEQQELLHQYGECVDNLTTGLHEVVGHASGQSKPGVGTLHETLKNYASCLEEARADLVALYYIGDEHLVNLGLTPTTRVQEAEFTQFMVNGLYRQLVRVELGKNLEEAHMRNRQLIAQWAYQHGKKDNVVELIKRGRKTFVQINDFSKLRELFGQLLREVQRIKSEGDYEAGKELVETYAVKFDHDLHLEVLERWRALDLPTYYGFVNPNLELVSDDETGEVLDVKVTYPQSFAGQMLYYAEHHSYLPDDN